MALRFYTAIALCASLALSACVRDDDRDDDDRSPPPPPPVEETGPGPEQFIQNISLKPFLAPALNIRQTFQPRAGRPGTSRICVRNQTNYAVAFKHGFAGVNTLSMGAGGQSCANFPSDARVTFTPLLNSLAAAPAKTLAYSLGRWDGGILRLTVQ